MTIDEITLTEQTNIQNSTPVKRRTKGEKTREKILVSAIEILALSGIKGTTHRAIANHAQLQLSLTTYYFKDIQELIYQAFKLNSEKILTRADSILEASFIAISQIPSDELKKVSVREVLCQHLSSMASEHLIYSIKNKTTSLAVEQLMLTDVNISPRLRLLVQEHELAQLVPYEQLCSFFNQDNPEVDARIMYTLFSQLQYSQLSNQINIDCDLIEKTTHRIISWIMSI